MRQISKTKINTSLLTFIIFWIALYTLQADNKPDIWSVGVTGKRIKGTLVDVEVSVYTHGKNTKKIYIFSLYEVTPPFDNLVDFSKVDSRELFSFYGDTNEEYEYYCKDGNLIITHNKAVKVKFILPKNHLYPR